MPRIAVLQMTSGIDPWSNFETIRDAAYEAKKGGAEVLFTPEMSLLLDRDRKRAAEHIVEQHASRYVKMLSNLAEECNLWIALGSMAVALPEGRWANRSMLFPHSGEQPVCYDKMHMFDVNLADGENWRESNAYRPGDKPVAKDILLLRMTDAGEEEEEDFRPWDDRGYP